MSTRKHARLSSQLELGRLLRHWRDVRGKSQMALSLDTGISQRHLSFIESGRSAPSRQTLLYIAEALDVPFRDRNEWLMAGGFAPSYKENRWNAEEMSSVAHALDRMLRQHEPFPAIVMDRYWNIVMRNGAAPRFFNRFIDLDARPEPRNMLHLMFDPAGMRPFIVNWKDASKALIQRIQREAVGHTMDARTQELIASLLAYPDHDPGFPSQQTDDPSPTLPMVPLSFEKDGQVLRYFSMVTTVGTPQAIATQELRIESMFPADDATEAAHHRLMEQTGNMAKVAPGKRPNPSLG
ncbi:MAG TPA: helix-turn-helix transcriptional regulator [Dyella sp.]|uniref:helix-turn-helix domain-containing protein n=1 Tax=Dyella sp. TaxID=1869338 RepID=UPI002B608384|nr:helix-turn-helix transcriptional regulator [Dyella sp.]HUB89954.1 helix-turn-helix transcriptional regulator [Dyella sp.]